MMAGQSARPPATYVQLVQPEGEVELHVRVLRDGQRLLLEALRLEEAGDVVVLLTWDVRQDRVGRLKVPAKPKRRHTRNRVSVAARLTRHGKPGTGANLADSPAHDGRLVLENGQRNLVAGDLGGLVHQEHAALLGEVAEHVHPPAGSAKQPAV